MFESPNLPYKYSMTAYGSEVGQGDSLKLEQFTHRELALLTQARDRFLSGELNECMDDYRRLCFARWLYERGKIEG
jgi:hypothetical protein